MIEHMLYGFAGSILSTIPIGPINATLILFLLQKKYRIWWSCILGIVLADSIVALGSYLFLANMWPDFSKSTYGICVKAGAYFFSAGLIFLGAQVMVRHFADSGEIADQRLKSTDLRSHYKLASWFFWSFCITVIEPGLFPFWTGWWISTIHEFNDQYLILIGLIFSIVLGDGLVFFGYRAIVRKYEDYFSFQTLKWIRKISVLILYLVALLLFLRFLYLIYSDFTEVRQCL